ncbi:MAG: toll/interleukin-1 receptor domain-containing protein [Clostridia bacterium]|nr:toll/interleukin-1 receptor domain-containing protein [Clostridia bacterium]
MNVFVIHSGADYDATDKIISTLKQKVYSLHTLILKNGNCFWKLDASKKIKKSQMVLFVVGENSHKSPYIAWEIREAIKLKKPIYVLKLAEENSLHEALYVKNSFTEERENYGKVMSVEQIADVLKNYDAGDYGLFNVEPSELNQEALLEQYKLFLQTSEDLVNRRQNVNSFYISLSSAVVAIMGVLFALDFGYTGKLIVGAVFCIIGIILSMSWSKTLSCYGNLNGSKMKIISSIEKQLPLSLFDAEWAALSDKLNKKKYVSFTESEQAIPRLFGVLYLIILVLIVALGIIQ